MTDDRPHESVRTWFKDWFLMLAFMAIIGAGLGVIALIGWLVSLINDIAGIVVFILLLSAAMKGGIDFAWYMGEKKGKKNFHQQWGSEE